MDRSFGVFVTAIAQLQSFQARTCPSLFPAHTLDWDGDHRGKPSEKDCNTYAWYYLYIIYIHIYHISGPYSGYSCLTVSAWLRYYWHSAFGGKCVATFWLGDIGPEHVASHWLDDVFRQIPALSTVVRLATVALHPSRAICEALAKFLWDWSGDHGPDWRNIRLWYLFNILREDRSIIE